MSFFAFTLNIPASGNDPSDDQPLMQQNNNSTSGIIGIDHFTFQTANGGYHQQATLMNRVSIPTTIGATRGVIYTKKTTNSAAGMESSLFYTPDATSNEYQLTRTITAGFASFGTNAPYGSPPAGATFTGGWTFLPGGLLLQYGTVAFNPKVSNFSSFLVPFPIPFTNIPFSATSSANNTTGAGVNVNSSLNYSATQLSLSFSSSTAMVLASIKWMAIGI